MFQKRVHDYYLFLAVEGYDLFFLQGLLEPVYVGRRVKLEPVENIGRTESLYSVKYGLYKAQLMLAQPECNCV